MASITPAWVSSQKSHIWIFNVGRGLAIFIRTPLNQGILYDFGSSEDFKPSDFLKEHIIPYLNKYKGCPIAQTIISHPHLDHIINIECTIQPDSYEYFYSYLHTCPHDKTIGCAKPEAIDWKRIKNPEGAEKYIDIYKSLYIKRSPPLQTIVYDSTISIPNLEYGLYYVRPPVVNEIFPDNNQEYGNGISLVLYYRHGFHTLLIPGDINPAAFKHLLDEGEGLEKRYTIFDQGQSRLHPNWHELLSDQPSLKSLLGKHGLSILVAPHHGLESGFSEDLYRAIKDEKPGLVVISEKRYLTDKDGKIEKYYQTEDGAIGQEVSIEGKLEKCFSVTTKNGHHILILFQGTGGKPEVFLEKEPQNLLTKLK